MSPAMMVTVLIAGRSDRGNAGGIKLTRRAGYANVVQEAVHRTDYPDLEDERSESVKSSNKYNRQRLHFRVTISEAARVRARHRSQEKARRRCEQWKTKQVYHHAHRRRLSITKYEGTRRTSA